MLPFVCISNVVATQDVATNPTLIEKKGALAQSDNGTCLVNIDLGILEIGSLNKVTIALTNALGKPIEFKSVSTDCNCISAQVPKVKVLASATEKLVFELSIRKNEYRTERSFGVSITSDGGADKIILAMTAKIAGVVALSEQSVVLDAGNNSSSDVPLKRRIAITTSELSLLKDASVSVSKELKGIVEGRVLIENGKAFLE